MKSGVGVWVAAACLAVGAPGAEARDYLVNQNYDTTEKGEFEVELYNDMNFSEADNDDSYNSKHQVELEYGVTNHLQLAYYEVYAWDRAEDWARDAFKIEAKLRFFEAGQLPVDVAFYTEYENPNGPRKAHSDVVENKLILSKDLGPWNLVGNFIFERDINRHSEWAFEYTAGISYPVRPTTRISLELKETLGDSKEFGLRRDDHQLQLVPGIYTNLTAHVRLLAGVAFGLTKAADDVQLKSLLEWEF